MKSASRFLSLALVMCLSSPIWTEAFEGTLDMSISSPTQSTSATGSLKGGHFKVVPKTALKMEGGVEGYPIINFETGKITLISPSEKYYLDMPLAALEAAINKTTVKFKASGRTETISGHLAEEFVLDGGTAAYTISFWATKDFSASANILISLQKTAPTEGLILGRMNADLMTQGYFPLRAEAKDAKGNVTIAMTVASLSPKKLDDKEFGIPDGYGKMSDVLKKKRGAKP